MNAPNEPLKSLDGHKKTPNGKIVRAVGKYIHEQQPGKGRSAFGLWKKEKINALEYEDRLRSEWKK